MPSARSAWDGPRRGSSLPASWRLGAVFTLPAGSPPCRSALASRSTALTASTDGSALFRTSTNGGVTWTAWSNMGLNASLLDPTTLQIAVNGVTMPDSSLQNRIQFQVTTGLGQAEQSSAYIVRVDTVAPASPTAMVSTPSGWTNVNSFRESWTNPPDTSGIAGAYYRLNSEPLFPADGTFVTTTNSIDGIQAPSEGSHTVLVWLVDGAGNVDHTQLPRPSQRLSLDATPPTVGVSQPGTVGQNGWYTGTVTVNFTPADATSGVLDLGLASGRRAGQHSSSHARSAPQAGTRCW